jgi:hypothetical protein
MNMQFDVKLRQQKINGSTYRLNITKNEQRLINDPLTDRPRPVDKKKSKYFSE